jgi:hypothetical protein
LNGGYVSLHDEKLKLEAISPFPASFLFSQIFLAQKILLSLDRLHGIKENKQKATRKTFD